MREKIEFSIRFAMPEDIDHVQRLGDRYDYALGAVMKYTLREHYEKDMLMVAEGVDGTIVGFCNFYIRKRDKVHIIYEICTEDRYRGSGIGRAFIDRLGRPLTLKCPVDLPSNAFYQSYGFTLTDVISGKQRDLNVWTLES